MNDTLVSSINYSLAKEYFQTTVTLKEIDSNHIFNAIVVDYCFEDQTGFIVRIKKNDIPLALINKYNMGESDYGKEYIECDMRDIFFGKNFQLIKTPNVFH